MQFSHTRNEVMRAQTQINQRHTGQDVFDGAMNANPDWRNVRKTLWVDSKRPFRVFKADESVICNRSPLQMNVIASDPYVDVDESKPLKSFEDRLVVKKTVKVDWSPEAVKKQQYNPI